jgi:chromosome partitioning protein
MGAEGQEPGRKHRRFFASRRPNEETDPTEESTGMNEPKSGSIGGSIRPAPDEDPIEAASAPGPVAQTRVASTPVTANPVDDAPLIEASGIAAAPEAPSAPDGDPTGATASEAEPATAAPPQDRIGGGRRSRRGPRRGPANPLPESDETVDQPVFEEIPPLQLPAILAVANQKGGVGKTTTAVNLGAALAELDYRVLVVDLDPQGNATTGLGINARDLQMSIYDVVMNDAAIEDCVEPTSVKNLFVAPATIDLAGAEIELVPAFSRELKLRRALEQVREEYDFTLIDCPPSLGLLTVNALAAADGVIVPIQCEYYALEGLGQLLRNVALVRTNLNPTLDVRGIVLTMYDARTKLADQVEQEVRAHFGPKVYRHTVPRNVRIGEAPSYGKPITVYDPMSRGAIAYRELAREVSSGSTRRIG